MSPDVLDEVETLSGMKVRAVLAPEKELKQALKKAYGSAPEHVYGENPYVSMERPGVGVGAAAKPLFQSWPSWNGWKALLWYAWSIRS